jgi:hypothetical protein
MSGSSGLSQRGRRAAVGGLMIVTLGTLAAGCGSSGPKSTTTSSGSKQTAVKSPITAAFSYARCMRSHGVTSFADPVVSSSPGGRSIAFHVTPSETGSPAFKTASQACQNILPAPSNAPDQLRAHKQGLLAFARCMRAEGIAGFPDPDLQGTLTLQMVSAAGVDVHTRKVLDAGESCAGVSNGAITRADVEAAVNGGQ